MGGRKITATKCDSPIVGGLTERGIRENRQYRKKSPAASYIKYPRALPGCRDNYARNGSFVAASSGNAKIGRGSGASFAGRGCGYAPSLSRAPWGRCAARRGARERR